MRDVKVLLAVCLLSMVGSAGAGTLLQAWDISAMRASKTCDFSNCGVDSWGFMPTPTPFYSPSVFGITQDRVTAAQWRIEGTIVLSGHFEVPEGKEIDGQLISFFPRPALFLAGVDTLLHGNVAFHLPVHCTAACDAYGELAFSLVFDVTDFDRIYRITVLQQGLSMSIDPQLIPCCFETVPDKYWFRYEDGTSWATAAMRDSVISLEVQFIPEPSTLFLSALALCLVASQSRWGGRQLSTTTAASVHSAPLFS